MSNLIKNYFFNFYHIVIFNIKSYFFEERKEDIKEPKRKNNLENKYLLKFKENGSIFIEYFLKNEKIV